MAEVTRPEIEELRRQVGKNAAAIARLDTRYAVINTKLTAILWLLGAVGSAVIAGMVKIAFGVGL